MNTERLSKLILIALAGVFGLFLFVFPDRAAAAFALSGSDEFAYRSGGAAFLGYAVAFAAGWTASTQMLRILWLATLGAAVATALAALIALATGHSGFALLLVLAGAVIAAAVSGYSTFASRPVLPAPTERRFSTWFVAFLAWGIIASALFGIGGLVLGSTFGSLLGFPGGDDPVYRFAGGATIGILVGTILALRTQDWEQLRLPVLVSFVTNVVTLIGGVLYIGHGAVPPVAFLVAGAAIFNIAGLGLALAGRR
jgi:hypothetical protein